MRIARGEALIRRIGEMENRGVLELGKLGLGLGLEKKAVTGKNWGFQKLGF